MVAPTVSNVFWIGVDNALIQVPQNYTVPANPPSIPNPPVSNIETSGTAIGGTDRTYCYTLLSMTPNEYKGDILTYLTGPAAGDPKIITANDTDMITTNAFTNSMRAEAKAELKRRGK